MVPNVIRNEVMILPGSHMHATIYIDFLFFNEDEDGHTRKELYFYFFFPT